MFGRLGCICPSAPRSRYTQTRCALDAPQVVVTPCHDADGEIRVLPPAEAQAPVRAFWRGPHEIIRQTGDTLRATHLVPGEYSVNVVDARGLASGVTRVEVEAAEIPTVVGYHVQHASADAARDGMVAAECRHVEAEHAVFWWTNGAQTRGAVLTSVPPGTYAALVMTVRGRRVRCLHATGPATVDVSTHAPSESPDAVGE